jgi:hypothetical protein
MIQLLADRRCHYDILNPRRENFPNAQADKDYAEYLRLKAMFG